MASVEISNGSVVPGDSFVLFCVAGVELCLVKNSELDSEACPGSLSFPST